MCERVCLWIHLIARMRSLRNVLDVFFSSVNDRGVHAVLKNSTVALRKLYDELGDYGENAWKEVHKYSLKTN